MGNFLVKEIQENMQLKLYNKLYNASEMTDLLIGPESVAERRKELTELIKVMRNTQKIIRRDLMTVIQININDDNITAQKPNKNKNEEQKMTLKSLHQNLPKILNILNPLKKQLKYNKNLMKKGYRNLFC